MDRRSVEESLVLDQIIAAVTGFPVEDGEQWLALSKNLPGVSFFATDVDPRSFEKDTTQSTWLGRAELLLKAPGALRPGQAMQEVSFTLPVRVLLSERGSALAVLAFDFYSADEREAPKPRYDPDD